MGSSDLTENGSRTSNLNFKNNRSVLYYQNAMIAENMNNQIKNNDITQLIRSVVSSWQNLPSTSSIASGSSSSSNSS